MLEFRRRPTFLQSRVGPGPPVNSIPAEHWFDAWMKRLALGGLSRRESLTISFRAGAAATVSSLISGIPFAGRAFAQASNTCVRHMAGNTVVDETTVEQGGLTVQQQRSYDSTNKTLTANITISRGQTLIAKIDSQSGPGGAGSATINYGDVFKGVRTATVNTPDGHSFRGTIDGRAFTASEKPSSMGAVQFADGKPAPQISADSSLSGTIKDLGNQLKAALASCKGTTPAPKPTSGNPPRRADTGRAHNSNGTIPCYDTCRNSNQGGWYGAVPAGDSVGPSCEQCWNNCGNTAAKYSGIEDWETYTNPVSFAYAMIAYSGIWEGCWGTCQLAGGGCCPVGCGYPKCCGAGATCYGGNLCCPSSHIVCNNVCCEAGVFTCGPDGFCGCPATMTICGNDCCTGTQACCGNACCAPGRSQCLREQGCCPAGTGSCRGDTCCPTGSPVCCGKNLCCPQGSKCCWWSMCRVMRRASTMSAAALQVLSAVENAVLH